MQAYTSDKTTPRGFQWIWFVRLPAIIFTLIVLGITAGDIADFHSATCSAPSRLSFNLAVSVISFFALLYLFLATGPKPIFRLLPWIVFGQIALDALVFIFWLAAAATSHYSCNDLCNACAGAGDVNYNTQYCVCNVLDDAFDDTFKRSFTPNRRGLLEGRTPRSHSSSSGSYTTSSSKSYSQTGGANVVKQALDAIMTIIFFVCFAASLFWFLRYRNYYDTPAPTAPVTESKYEEAGLPAGGAMLEYNSQQNASTGHHSGQPVAQQGGYHQPSMHQAAPQQQAYYPLPIGNPGTTDVFTDHQQDQPFVST